MTFTIPESVTIVGASLAGIRAAEALRRADFGGQIRLVGAESHLPYDRPPLSKQVLAGEWDRDRIALTKPEPFAEQSLDLMLDTTATGFDLASRTLVVESGGTSTELDVDAMIIATGARPRNLGGADRFDNVFVLRTIDDTEAILAQLEGSSKPVVVVGAGFIGAEVAATIRGRGAEVVLVEAFAYPMARALPEDLGMLCGQIHLDHGVDLRCGVSVASLEGDAAPTVDRVELSDGTVIETDLVVVGIGVIPNTEWLEGSGLEIDNGVVCDATCLAAPGVTAAGDIARWPNELFGETMRIEHWDNAVAQAGHAARRLLVADAEAQPYAPVPWFWSDQYDAKIQMAGRPQPDDETHIATGSVADGKFATIFGRDGKLTGVFGLNRPRHVMQYRMRIEQGCSWADALEAADQ